MRKQIAIFSAFIFIINLLFIHAVPTSASTKQVVDKGVNSCKGYTNKSKIVWGKIALNYEDYDLLNFKKAYKIRTLQKVTMYEQEVDKYRVTIDKVKKVKTIPKGKEFIINNVYGKTEVNNVLYYEVDTDKGVYLIKVDNKRVKVEKPSENLLSKLECAYKDNWAKNDPMYKKGVSILKQIITPDMSQFEQVKAINDYIAKQTQYDFDNYINNTIPDISYTKEGVFKKGVAVCEGYAEATKFLLTIAGFRNQFVVGSAKGLDGWGGHAWNAVKVNGKWYLLDTTWNDTDDKTITRYGYFLISEKKISQDHRGSFYYATDDKYDNKWKYLTYGTN